AGDVELVQDDVQDALLLLHTRGLADGMNGDADRDGAVGGDFLKVHVEEALRHGIELEIADDRHARSRVTFELQREQLGRSLMAVDDAEYRSRIDRDGFWLGAAIEHGRDDAVAAQALGQLLAGALTARNRQFL